MLYRIARATALAALMALVLPLALLAAGGSSAPTVPDVPEKTVADFYNEGKLLYERTHAGLEISCGNS